MKYKVLFVLFFSFFCAVSCKDNAAKDTKAELQTQAETSIFKVTLKFIAEVNDDFCLLYTEDGTINFGEKGVWTKIVGSKEEQTVQIQLPEDAYPTALRLDLGIKPEQKDIILKTVIFEYAGKKREITGDELAVFFSADESKCKFDAKTGVITAVVKDGVSQNRSLYPQKVLEEEIKKLVK